MGNIKIRSNGITIEASLPPTVEEVLLKAGYDPEGLVASKVRSIQGNGTWALRDLTYLLNQDSEVEPVYLHTQEGIEIVRHSTAHVMAMAVKELFPGAKVAIGPAIEDGFYYDFDFERSFKEEDLPVIEAKMRELVQRDIPFEREELEREEAIRLFRSLGENYKVEILEEIQDPTVSVYKHGNFIDLCRGPHVPSTRYLRAFKLHKVAGAYWRGDERNQMLSRIYGLAFATEEELQDYLNRLKEAQKRNHIRLGQELELFSIQEEVGPGLVIWHPKGMMLRYLLEQFEIKEHLKRGYEMVRGPEILKTELWVKSGHFDNYRENMYFTTVDEQSYGLKPMNCLSHMLIYKSKLRSYRDLPKRYFELGVVHRHERSGVLSGLLRVREFTQDDAHIICTPEQLDGEIKGVLSFVDDVMGIFGFPYELEISTRPEKSIGTDEDWERATNALKKAVEGLSKPYEINEGEGAFYGPKIDVKLRDALNRKWQCATIQCDFTLPERFDLVYIDHDGQRKRPVMIHRVILGAIERFVAILIEHYGGAFPLWLAPVQVAVLTVADRHIPFGQEVLERLRNENFRAQGDFRNEKLGAKIREGELQKIPYLLVIGDKEVENRAVSPRQKGKGSLPAVGLEEFVSMLKQESQIRG